MSDRSTSPSAVRRANLLRALSIDKPSQQAYETLWIAARTWLYFGGGVPMERFAGLPSTGPSLTLANRDLWLLQAAQGLQATEVFEQANELAVELEKFITRGPWRIWCQSARPPAEASELRKALFFAARFNHGKTLSARQIYRVLLP